AVVEHLQVIGFNETLWAYEIEFCKTLDLLDLDQLLHILPHGPDIYYVQDSAYVNVLSQEEIDGATLARLPYDEVRTLFPKLKDRILFTEKRDLLIKQCDNIANEQLDDGDILNQFSKQIFDTCTTSQAIALTQDLLNNPSLSSNNMNGNEFDAASNIDDEVNHDETDDLEEPQQHLPTDFAFSSLPEEIQIYVSTIMDESDVEQLVIVMKDGIENGTINNDELITLWKKTFGYLRSFIRSHTINEILDKFPGYSYTHFVSLF
ncbi:unnamed protein product, partial [Adineta steineri]